MCRRTKIRSWLTLLYGGEIWSIGAHERGRLSYHITRDLRGIMAYHWDDFGLGDLHDMTPPTAIIWSGGEVPAVESSKLGDLWTV